MPLGKSLGNILGDYFGEESVKLNPSPQKEENSTQTLTLNIAISRINLSQYQTRTNFDFEKIQSLAKNIKENGLIHPIVVVSKGQGEELEYILLAGERRLRACKMLEWSEIIAIVKPSNSLSSRQQAMLSAMENLQREDLSPIELANTFKMLMQTQEIDEGGVANLVESSVQYVKNYLRLLQLSPVVQQALLERSIGEGQARHLVGLDVEKQVLILKKIIQEDLTVKEIISLLKAPNPKDSVKSHFHNLSTDTVQKASKFAQSFPNSKLKCEGNPEKGKITISWDNSKHY